MSDLPGYSEAMRLANDALSPRAQRIRRYEAYVNGQQYDGRKGYWDTSVPTEERAPCIVYLILAEAIESNVDLVMGDGRFPTVTSKPEGDGEEDPDAEEGDLSEDESAGLDKFMGKLAKAARFEPVTSEAFASAQAQSSTCGVFGVRDGKPFCDLVSAWWCEPTLAPDDSVSKLVIQYPYLAEYQDQAGRWRVRPMLYRREIDAVSDTTMQAVELTQTVNAATAKWKPESRIEHGWGFCPVIWYPFMRGAKMAGTIDGHAIGEHMLDEVERLDQVLSQRHASALMAGDPQWTECGVDPGFNPSAGGRTAVIPATREGGVGTTANPVVGGYPAAGGSGTAMHKSSGARKKGGQYPWQYTDKDTVVKLHTLPGEALKALDDDARDLRLKICEGLAVVFLDPEYVKGSGALSGKALSLLKQRQKNRCSRYRDDLGARWIVPGISMLLRICHVVAKRGEKLRVRGFRKIAPMLAKFEEIDTNAAMVSS